MSLTSTSTAKASAAVRLINAGNISGAERLVKELLATDPEDAHANALMALVLLRQGKPQAAVEQADIALGLDPTADAFRFKAVALLRLKQYGRAIEAAEAGVRAGPAYGYAAFTLAEALDNANRPMEAEAAYRRAVALEPGSDVFRGALGRFLLRRRDLNGAEGVAAEIDPNSEAEAALLLRGDLALYRGKPVEARDVALWALSNNATSQAALSLLVRVKARQSLGLGLWWRYSMFFAVRPRWVRIPILVTVFIAMGVLSNIFDIPSSSFFIFYMPIIYSLACKFIFARMVASELKTVRLRKGF
jgi:predicted Zn-dependent protease